MEGPQGGIPTEMLKLGRGTGRWPGCRLISRLGNSWLELVPSDRRVRMRRYRAAASISVLTPAAMRQCGAGCCRLWSGAGRGAGLLPICAATEARPINGRHRDDGVGDQVGSEAPCAMSSLQRQDRLDGGRCHIDGGAARQIERGL